MSIKIEVDGIHCGSCANRITKAIQTLGSDARVNVDIKAGTVEVDAAIERTAIVGAIEDAGYSLRKAS